MAERASLLSDVRFASYLVYSPRGTSDTSVLSRRIRDAVKGDHPGQIQKIAARIVADQNPCTPILGPDVTLIPAPRSAPLVTGGLWPARRIADELARQRLGQAVVTPLSRARPVPKSAFAAAGERPTAQQHLDSFVFDPCLIPSDRITIVDDFVTKGSTLLAAASLLARYCPTAHIAVFAMIRTLGLQPDVERIIDPCLGAITLLPGGGTDRRP